MMMYRVVYEIDVEATSTIEAAREAFTCMKAPPILDVIPWPDKDTPPTFTCDTPNCTSIDLEEATRLIFTENNDNPDSAARNFKHSLYQDPK